MKIEAIFRYPLKGFGPERLDAVRLSAGEGVPLDRLHAVAHGSSEYDPADPRWVPRRNFLVLARSPRLAAIDCAYEPAERRFTFRVDGREALSVAADDPDGGARLAGLLSGYVSSGQQGPFRLASLGGRSLTDSPAQAVSVMSARSLAELERVCGGPLDRRRFRGNLWLDGGAPWAERDWVGKTLLAGGATLRVVEEIERCAAIDADPEGGGRDLTLLRTLGERFGHVNFGVLAEVVADGEIAVGGTVSIDTARVDR